MLVLSRMRDQVTMIGDEIRVTVLDIQPWRTVMLIEAPNDLLPHDPDRDPPHRAILSFQRGEGLRLGRHIEFQLVDIRGDKVRMGFNTPPAVPVRRKEVYDAIRRENDRDQEP